MARVPYSPVPVVQPTSEGLPRPAVNAPVEAFGGAVGHALSNLGTAARDAGNEIFGRAIAMQDLQNRQEADRLVSENMIAAAPLIAEYSTLRGEDAVKGLQPHIDALDKSRKDIAAKASNPAVQRLFDSESRSFLARSVFSSALHSGQELKSGALAAATAEQGVLQNQTFHLPDDESGFRAAIEKNHRTAEYRATLMPGGASPQRTALLIQQGDYSLSYHRITGMAVENPSDAAKLLKQYIDEGLIGGKEAEAAEVKIAGYAKGTGTDQVSRAILAKYSQPDGTYAKPFSEMQKEVQEKLAELYPGIPGIKTAGAQALDRIRYQEKVATNIDNSDTQVQWRDYIQKGATTVSQLPKDLQARIPPQLVERFNADVMQHVRHEHEISREHSNLELRSLYQNNTEKFLETNVMKVPGLSWADQQNWLKLQRNPQPGGDPRVDKAIHNFRDNHANDLIDLFGKKNVGNRRNHDWGMFTAATHDAIQAWQEANERAPTEKELNEQIWPSLIRKVTRPGWFAGLGMTSEQELFRADVVKEVRQDMEQEAGKKLTDEEARHLYNIRYYNTFFKELRASKKSEE